MSQEVTLNQDVVRVQLGALETLMTDLDRHFGPMRAAQGRQGAGLWTEIDSCTAFASSYSGALGGLETALQSIRDEIGAAMTRLRLNATDMENRDQENRDRFAALAQRLADGAPAPVTSPFIGSSLLLGTSSPETTAQVAAPPTSGGGGGW